MDNKRIIMVFSVGIICIVFILVGYLGLEELNLYSVYEAEAKNGVSPVIIREQFNTEQPNYIIDFKGEENIIIYNEENIMYNVTCYEIEYDESTSTLKNKGLFGVKGANVLNVGEKLLIKVKPFEEEIASLKVVWEDHTGAKTECIVYIDNSTGQYNMSFYNYEQTFISIIYNIFN